MPESLMKIIGALVAGALIIPLLLWQLLNYLLKKVAADYEKRLTSIERDVSAIREQVAAIHTELQQQAERISLIDSRVTAQDRGHGRHEARMAQIENTMGEIEKEAMHGRSKLHQRVDTLAERTITREEHHSLSRQMESLGKSLHSVSERIDRLYTNNK